MRDQIAELRRVSVCAVLVTCALWTCTTPAAERERLRITNADWQSSDARLGVEGRSAARQVIQLRDAHSGVEIGTTTSDRRGRWRFRRENMSASPCRVEALTETGRSVERDVEDAPSGCGIVAGDPAPAPGPSPAPGPGPGPAPEPVSGAQIVTAFNDLGMHCVDSDFSVFSILPPFNVVNVQVITRGDGGAPRILDTSQVEVRYSPIADVNGSINSTSVGKTNFWDVNPATGNSFAQDLFGAPLQPDEGLLGQRMPSAANGAQPFGEYRTEKRWFTAAGIPIMPIDDAGNANPYPLLRVEAYERSTGALLAQTDVVVPVSDETDCQNCHATGEIAASDAAVAWSQHANRDLQTRENVLILHDALHATALTASQPVLCAGCHYSPALDLARAGPQGAQLAHNSFSNTMHNFHGKLTVAGQPLFAEGAPVEQTCYQCHPGSKTQCLRGAMADAGMTCESCHGGMLAVGGEFPLRAGGSVDGNNDGGARRPWLDLPRCQSCHTGDANAHLGAELVLRQAYLPGDASASPILASNERFAENAGELYRESLGHGGVACEGCHGSTHAIWPNGNPLANDNIAASQLQGHSGSVAECTTCHEAGSLPLTTAGPHGLHNIGDARWNLNHEDFYESNRGACMACHGRNLEGTVLARTQADRTWRTDDDGARTIQVARGTQVSCTLCHENPLFDD